MKTIANKKIAIFVSLLFLSTPLYATVTDISGTYSGTLNINNFACADSADNGAHSGALQITLSGNTNGTFIGSGSFDDEDGDASSLTVKNGTNDNSTFAFDFTFTPHNGSGTTSGTFTSSSVQISGGGSDDNCNFTFSGTLTKGNQTVSSATPSSTITNTILFNTQIQSVVSDISRHITGALSGMHFFASPSFGENSFKIGGLTGLNAGGDTTIPYGIWGNYSYTDYKNDLSSTAFDGTSHSFLGGIDFGFWENTILGVSFGYDNSDIDTTFNGGNQQTDSFTVAPYFGAILNDTLSLDFNLGYSNVEYDQYRTLTGTTTRITSSPNADRWFGSLNLNAIKFIDQWIIGGRVGALYANSVINSYTESNGTAVGEDRTKVGTFSLAGDVAYSLQNYEPFLNLAYQYDFSLRKVTALSGPQPSNDRDDVLLTAGVRYFEKSGISGNLEYSKRLTRSDFDEDRVSLTVRVDY